jgi:hypothetical protein
VIWPFDVTVAEGMAFSFHFQFYLTLEDIPGIVVIFLTIHDIPYRSLRSLPMGSNTEPSMRR